MGEQFIKVYKSDFDALKKRYCYYRMKRYVDKSKKEGKKITSNDKPINVLLELSIISFIRDRMKSSRKRKNFTNGNGISYVVMTHEEITNRFNCTGRSCTRALKDLEKFGFISLQRNYMQANKYYLNNVNSVKTAEMGYYKFYLRYFDEFNHKLNIIYAYMILKDFAEQSRYLDGSNGYHFIDDDGKYFVAKNLEDICKELTCSLPTAGKIMNLLEKNGYIRRKRRRHAISRIYLLK